MPSEQTVIHPQVRQIPSIETLQIGNSWFAEQAGGLGRVYYELFRHLPPIGVNFRALVIGSADITNKYGESVRAFAEAGDSLHRRLLNAREAISETLTRIPIDLVVSHFALYTIPALHVIKRHPMVIHFHGPWAAEGKAERSMWLKSTTQEYLERSVYRRASRFIVLSKAFQLELTRRYKVPEELVRIVPAGVDTDRFDCSLSRKEARERLGWPKERFIVISVRRLARRMGLDNLVAAMKLIASSTADVDLYIVGQGPMAEELQNQIKELDISNHVRLLGRIEDDILPMMYRAADLSVVPTVALEGFGMITLESLSSGTPVLVTPVGGLPEVVENLSKSMVLEDSCAISIAKGIREVINGATRLPDEKACRQYAENNFSWPVVADRIRSVYLEALS
jgi:glycosyltransferase involved in cell wall biosynthesis